MDLFIHQENQKILWTLIQKHTLYSYFLKTLTIQGITGEMWFRNNIEELYDMLYKSYKDKTTYDDLITMNKYALSHLIIQLKKSMGAGSGITTTTNAITNVGQYMKNEFILPSYESPDAYNPNQQIVVSEEIKENLQFPLFSNGKKEREQQTIKEFEKLKEKYDELHLKPSMPQLNLTTVVEKTGENVAELAKIQEEMRKLDSQYIIPPPELETFDKKISQAFTMKYTNM